MACFVYVNVDIIYWIFAYNLWHNKKILSYNENFIIRKGEIVPVISKNCYRFRPLNSITIKLKNIYDNCYNYDFQNLYNYEERNTTINDLFQVTINETNDEISWMK